MQKEITPPSNNNSFSCNLIRQGYARGSCLVKAGKEKASACQLTLRGQGANLARLIKSLHLSRPENYFSIYQSGCNLSCRKCHSWEFSQVANGQWYTAEEIAKACVEYEGQVTLWEPRERCTAWHAGETCRCCGRCVIYGVRGPGCPGVLAREQVVLSPQGFGPARNIVGFTGGDLTCRPYFYAQCAEKIKANTKLWVLIETNGYGLTEENLNLLAASGVDGFWLDIKAYDGETHGWLTGGDNKVILELPAAICRRGFVLEVLSLYIPKVVETDQLVAIARLLFQVNPKIPFTILAFFPAYRMMNYRGPTVEEMARSYQAVKEVGLRNVRLGNLGVFIKKDEDYLFLKQECGEEVL